ncbi:MAG: IPT/TIG domain-containing protein [Myxococcota bacterium]
MVLSIAGCVYIDLAEHEARLDELRSSTTTETEPTMTVPPTLGGLSPAYGTDAGGVEVTLTGGSFGLAPEVRFGDAVATVLTVTADTLVVSTPASPVAAGPNQQVAVTVRTDGGEVTLPNAFTYWPDATGRIAATGELVWFRVVGDYWSDTGGDYGRATLRFTQATEYEFYKYWAPELDTCIRITGGVPEYTYDPQVESIDAFTGSVIEASPSASTELDWNAADVRFVRTDMLREEFAPGETYDVELVGTTGLPEITIPGVFEVPADFEVLAPAIDGQDPPPITADQHFEWSTDETADVVLIQIGMLDADEIDFEQEVYCAVRDVGSFWLPPGVWDHYAPDRFVNLLIGRYNTGSGTLPWNNGKIGAAAQLWYYGGAQTQ